MEKRKILLLYITDRSGHNKASLAIETALNTSSVPVEILNLNFFHYTYPFLEKVIDRTYLQIIKRTPDVWEYLYDNPRVLKKTQKIKEFVNQHSTKKIEKLLSYFKPDCICCTQAFPCGVIANFKKQYNSKIPLVGVLTDYVVHGYWRYDNVDYYVVPSEEIKMQLMQESVDADKVKTYGIPVDPRFAISTKKDITCLKYNLNPDMPILLIMGGGQGLGPIRTLVQSVLAHELPVQIVVVTGQNEKLYKALHALYGHNVNKVKIFGYVNTIYELMEIAYLIITKPGGLTISEALVKCLPMIIVDPLPGQEQRNTEYLTKQGVAIQCKAVKEVGTSIQMLLSGTERYETMKQAAAAIGKPHAAVDIGNLLLSI